MARLGACAAWTVGEDAAHLGHGVGIEQQRLAVAHQIRVAAVDCGLYLGRRNVAPAVVEGASHLERAVLRARHVGNVHKGYHVAH